MEWCSEDNNVMNFSKILLKFAVVFKIFAYFFPFLSLTIITGQRSLLSLANGLNDKHPDSKRFLNIFFSAICGNFSSEFCTFSFFRYDLVTNKAKSCSVESHHGKNS